MARVKTLNTGLGVTVAIVSGQAFSNNNMDILNYPAKVKSLNPNVKYMREQEIFEVDMGEICHSVFNSLPRDFMNHSEA